MSGSNRAVADEHARPSDAYRERIVAAARPVDLPDAEKIELTQDEADFFFETLRNT